MTKPPYRAPLRIELEDNQLKISLSAEDGAPRGVRWPLTLFTEAESKCHDYKAIRTTRSTSEITLRARLLADSIKKILFNKDQNSNEKNEIWNFLNSKRKEFHIIIEIHTTSYIVANLPWEFAGFLADNEKSNLKTFGGDFSVVRTPVDVIAEPQPRRRPGVYETRLICSADPTNSPIKENIAEQAAGILNLKLPWLIDREDIFNITLNALKQQVATQKPYVFHFVGHGETNYGAAGLIMDTNANQNFGNLQTTQELESIFRGQAPRLAVLMACESAQRTAECPSVAECLIRAGAHFAIGNLFPIGAPAAQCFAEHFYKYIQDSSEDSIPLYAALESARSSADNEAKSASKFHYASAYTPVVYTDGSAESLYLPLRPSSDSLNEIILNLCARMTRQDFSYWRTNFYEILKRGHITAVEEADYTYLFGRKSLLFSKISLLTKLLVEVFSKSNKDSLVDLRRSFKDLIEQFANRPF